MENEIKQQARNYIKASHIESISPQQDNKYSRVSSPENKWSEEQDQRLIYLAQFYNCKQWTLITQILNKEFLTNRKPNSVNQRYNRVLNKNLTKGKWSPKEDEKLEKLLLQNPNFQWKDLRQYFNNRSDTQIRYRVMYLKNDLLSAGVSKNVFKRKQNKTGDLYAFNNQQYINYDYIFQQNDKKHYYQQRNNQTQNNQQQSNIITQKYSNNIQTNLFNSQLYDSQSSDTPSVNSPSNQYISLQQSQQDSIQQIQHQNSTTTTLNQDTKYVKHPTHVKQVKHTKQPQQSILQQNQHIKHQNTQFITTTTDNTNSVTNHTQQHTYQHIQQLSQSHQSPPTQSPLTSLTASQPPTTTQQSQIGTLYYTPLIQQPTPIQGYQSPIFSLNSPSTFVSKFEQTGIFDWN